MPFKAFLRVRSLTRPMFIGPIAQGLEQLTHNQLVPGSIPGGSTIKSSIRWRFFYARIFQIFSTMPT